MDLGRFDFYNCRIYSRGKAPEAGGHSIVGGEANMAQNIFVDEDP